MGDIINNMEVFKKLDFDSSNQWIFYDERFHKFFDFFANNITDSNILLETEILDHEEYVKRNEYLGAVERKPRLDDLEKEYMGLFSHTKDEVDNLQQDYDIMEMAFNDYNTMVEDMRETKHLLNCEFSRLEERFNTLKNKEKDLLSQCQAKAKQLEDMEMENHKKCEEVLKTFSKMQSPPLFMHQLPLDQYFLKCESFTQYFSLYIKENFKIQEFIELETSLTENQETIEKLGKLKKGIEQYTLAYVMEKAKSHALRCAIDALNLTQIHVISLSDMEKETHELAQAKSRLEIAHQTLMVDLQHQVQQKAQQTVELILYENTKQKLERALKRHENDRNLRKIISEALSNAELIWMTIQMDMEKKRNRFDNTEQLTSDSQRCAMRIQYMKNSQSQGLTTEFIQQLSQMLAQHLQQQLRCEVKACLYEYEKFKRLMAYALQGLLNRKPYSSAMEKFKEINRIESILRPFVYDSPVNAPMFENVHYLRPIFNVKTQQYRIEKHLRQLRTEFHDNVTERLEKDKLWRYSQLLWIWFLTEPRRVLHAIEEAKKAAAKVPQMTGIKTLGGIKRK
ncbi:augmin complex subunit dgt3-like [Musca domestica]|uniref:Augmin complex subunit dgt3-like n=1 Tax=Musca domestica TaxID=7370 RepID=A0ABM3USR7_MUSDO|nr:augmin complex subunit dgt3-like [Musca domestica]